MQKSDTIVDVKKNGTEKPAVSADEHEKLVQRCKALENQVKVLNEMLVERSTALLQTEFSVRMQQATKSDD